MKSYLGEQDAELCPELGRESWRSTTSSGEEHRGGKLTVAWREVADTSPPEFFVIFRCALLGY